MTLDQVEKQIQYLEREMYQHEDSGDYEALADVLERINELEEKRDELLASDL